jgi:hypothetical protein
MEWQKTRKDFLCLFVANYVVSMGENGVGSGGGGSLDLKQVVVK